MDGHAGSTTLPELDECLSAFQVRFRRPEVERMIAEATVDNGVLIGDNVGFAEQGKVSIGVARQY